jgi:hypothetical protein
MTLENESDQSTHEKNGQCFKRHSSHVPRRFGINLDIVQIENSIRDRPLRSMAVAAAAGFIVGGGMATRPGVAILALFGRTAVKETATNLMTGMVRARER